MQLPQYPQYSRYKDSGEGWIGEIPEHWGDRKLKHLFKEKKHRANMDLNCGAISFGEVVEKDDDRIPLSTKASYQEVLAGEFLVNPLNLNYDLKSLRIGLSDINVVVSAGYIILQAASKLEKRYFKYLLHRYDVANMKLLGSGVRQTISFNHIANSVLVAPPLEEQRAIASFLDDKTDKIDQAVNIKEGQIALLKERKQIIVQEAVTKGLNPDAPMKDSDIDWVGQIPGHWDVKPSRFVLRSVRRFDRDGTEVKLSVTQKRGIVPTDEMQENSTQATSFDEFQICHEGDLILNKYKAHLGVFWMSPYRGIITNNYTVFKPLMGVVSKYYETLFHTAPYISMFRTSVYGVTEGMMPLYTSDFYALPALCPPESEQIEILKWIDLKATELDEAIELKQRQIEALKEYKATLINAAVTGKIKVI